MSIVDSLLGPWIKRMVQNQYYSHIHVLNEAENLPRWRGLRLVKHPQDVALYAQVVFEKKPDCIIETGTFLSGSANFFGDLLSLTGGKKVITVDIRPIHQQDKFERQPDPHPLVNYILGSSVDGPTVELIKERVADCERIMIVLDSSHEVFHVMRELEIYSKLVSDGQYLVVEDCYAGSGALPPKIAVEAFLKSNSDFERVPLEDQFIFSVTRGGWLTRRMENLP